MISSKNPQKERKNYILIQQVERRWSNSHSNAPSYKIDDSEPNLAGPTTSRRPSKVKSRLSYQYNRTNSLSAFHNTSILNYAKAMATSAAANENKAKSNASSSDKKHNVSPKNIKILQNHEKIMEVQNKWTGNGKFILMEKSNFLVNMSCFKTDK